MALLGATAPRAQLGKFVLTRTPSRPSSATATIAPASSQAPSPAPRAGYATTNLGPPRLGQRCFSQTTASLAKKLSGKGKKAARAAKAAAKEREADEEADEDEDGDGEPPEAPRQQEKEPDFDYDAAFSFADVDAAYRAVNERFDKRLIRFRAGARFNPDVLGGLKVQMDAKNGGETYPLRELAQVVHRGGRTVSILVSEASYIKLVMSAIQNSPEFNQQPQRDPDNDLELVIKIEPENPDEQTKRAKEVCHAWRDASREVLAKRAKDHAGWFKKKIITKDDRKTLDTKVKKMQDDQLTAIDKKEKEVLQSMASRQTRI